MSDILKSIWNNPKHRNILILTTLLLVLAVLIIVQIMNIAKPPPEGAFRVVICKECSTKYFTRIKNLKDKSDKRNKCKECGGELAFVWKCDECQFEYPEIKMDAILKKLGKTMDKFQAVVESRRCPNCLSLSAHPISVQEFKNEKKVERKNMNELRKTIKQ